MAARPNPFEQTGAATPARQRAALRQIGPGDTGPRSPARELQNALVIALAPVAVEPRLPVAARLAVISGLAMASWGLFGGAAYLIVR